MRSRCPRQVSHFSGTPVLKLPSHLAKSRHGVYYLRMSYRVGDSVHEKRVSLRTKNATQARAIATQFSVIFFEIKHKGQRALASTPKPPRVEDVIDGSYSSDTDLLKSIMSKLGHLPSAMTKDQDAIRDGGFAPKDVRKLDVELPNGVTLKNIQNDDDLKMMGKVLQTLNLHLTPEQLARQLATQPPSPTQAEPLAQSPTPASAGSASNASLPQEQAGTTIQEMVPRFATRRRSQLSEKALYEYGNHQRKFVAWLEKRKRSKHIPIRLVTREDVADFIADLQVTGLSDSTIQQKYLAPLNGLFELAQSSGVIPLGEIVSRGHKVFSKKAAKRADSKNGYKPFTNEELTRIFHPQFLSQAERPADFWAPLLGLFTGARLNELCQLDIQDIQQQDGIWAIHFIDDAPDKSLKTAAARRWVPIHPTLLELGFLHYVNDAAQCLDGRKLFPYLSHSKLDGYASTPSERWGNYLDTISITDPQKVFHSFRSTANDRLKQNGVPEESRCQFVGHEHDTVNSVTYSNAHNLAYLLEHVASKLSYPSIDFQHLLYIPGQFTPMLQHLCALKARRLAHTQAKAQRLARKPGK